MNYCRYTENEANVKERKGKDYHQEEKKKLHKKGNITTVHMLHGAQCVFI